MLSLTMSHTSSAGRFLAAVGLKSEKEFQDRLQALAPAELLQVRRIIDRALSATAPTAPVVASPDGRPFRVVLTDDLHLGNVRVRRTLTFIDEYGASAVARGRRPTIAELAIDTGQSVATINRRLTEFRDAFPGERDPHMIARELRGALCDGSLRGLEKSIHANVGDVPVVWREQMPTLSSRR